MVEVTEDTEQVDTERLRQTAAKKLLLGNSRCVADFAKVQQIGTGTYGVVFLARDKQSNKEYALKQIKMAQEQDGFPITSLREVAILTQLRQKALPHPNIVKLEEVVVGYKQESIFLAFEYCRIDLANLIDRMVNSPSTQFFSLSEIKCLMLQLVKAVIHLHDNDIIHRDLKLSNLLLTDDGVLKLADFGLARQLSEKAYSADMREKYSMTQMTPKVVTLWYRAPEILLRCGEYSKPADVWAVACILAELLNKGRPIFPGHNEIDQLTKICDLIGKPVYKEDWRDFFKLENVDYLLGMTRNKKNNIGHQFKLYPDSCIDLLERMLRWDPRHRLTMNEVLLHPFFTEQPYPCSPVSFQRFQKIIEEISQSQRKQPGGDQAQK